MMQTLKHTYTFIVLWILLGFYGDRRDEYSGIEMGTGSTQAIWGVAMFKKGAYYPDFEFT